MAVTGGVVATSAIPFLASLGAGFGVGGGITTITVGGSTILISTTVLVAASAVILAAVAAVGVVVGNSVLNDKAREIRDEVTRLLPGSETAAVTFRDSAVGPTPLENSVTLIRVIINNLEDEILRN